MERAMILMSMVIMAYIVFISTKQNYVVLTIISEILNLFRTMPIAYGVKVLIDMHREYMKLCI